MLVEVISGVSRGMDVLGGGDDVEGEGAVFGVKFGHPNVITSRDFVA